LSKLIKTAIFTLAGNFARGFLINNYPWNSHGEKVNKNEK